MPNLIFRLIADATGFEAGMAKAEKRVGLTAGHMSSLVGRMFSAVAVEELSRRTVELGSKFNDVALATSETTDTVQELNFAATKSGSSLEHMEKALLNLAKARREALSGGEAGDKAMAGFAAQGITKEQLEAMRKPSELLYQIGDAVKATNADLNTLPGILDLIGEKNVSVLTAMKDGLRESAQEAHELGVVLDKETVENLDAMGDRWSAVFLRMQAAIAPVLGWLAVRVDDLFKGFEIAGLKVETLANRWKLFTSEISKDEFTRRQQVIEIETRKVADREPPAVKKAKPGSMDELAELAKLRATLEKNSFAAALKGMSAEQRRLALAKELNKEKAKLIEMEAEAARKAAEIAKQEQKVRAAMVGMPDANLKPLEEFQRKFREEATGMMGSESPQLQAEGRRKLASVEKDAQAAFALQKPAAVKGIAQLTDEYKGKAMERLRSNDPTTRQLGQLDYNAAHTDAQKEYARRKKMQEDLAREQAKLDEMRGLKGNSKAILEQRNAVQTAQDKLSAVTNSKQAADKVDTLQRIGGRTGSAGDSAMTLQRQQVNELRGIRRAAEKTANSLEG